MAFRLSSSQRFMENRLVEVTGTSCLELAGVRLR